MTTAKKGEAVRPAQHRAGASLEHLARLFPLQEAVGVLDRRTPLSLAQRAATLGPVTVLDVAFDVDTWIRCAEQRPYYQVNVVAVGQMELLHRGFAITSAPGVANVCLAEGPLTVRRWGAGSRMIAFRVDRHVVDDALGEALGRQLTTQIDFKPSLVTSAGRGRTWMGMFNVLVRELFRPDSALTQPVVASPFVDSLIHTLLLAADHPHRELLDEQAKIVAPQAIRPAIEIIEAQPHLPLTVSSLARLCNMSARTMQKCFLHNLDISPMAYLRQVRVQRAHQDLLASDPTVETVTSIAKRWGFTNPGRFASAHMARYGETPAATLRRSAQSIRRHSPNAPIRRVGS